MMELFHLSIQSVVLPFTVLLGILLFYWLIILLGVFDLEFLDGAFDLDLDVDVDVDVDASGGGSGFFLGIAQFFGVGGLPILIPLSFLIFGMWTCAILLNYYLNPGLGLPLGLGFMVLSILGGLVVTKLGSIPFIPLYRKLNHNPEDELRAEGQLCVLLSSILDEGIGQAEVQTNGAPLLLTVRRGSGPILHKGDEALVLNRDTERDIYTIRKIEE